MGSEQPNRPTHRPAVESGRSPVPKSPDPGHRVRFPSSAPPHPRHAAQRRCSSSRARSSSCDSSRSISRWAPRSKPVAQQLLALARAACRCPARCPAAAVSTRPSVNSSSASPRSSRPVTTVNSASRHQPEHRALGLVHRPAPGPGVQLDARRVTGRAELEGAGVAGRGRRARRWRSPRSSPGAAGSRWRPAGTSRRQRAEQPAEGAGEQQRPGARPARPCRRRRRRPPASEPPSRGSERDDEVAGERRSRRPSAAPPRRTSRRAARASAPGCGSGRAGPPASTRPRTPATPSRVRRNDETRMIRPIRKITTTPPMRRPSSTLAWRPRRCTSTPSDEHHDPGQRARARAPGCRSPSG